jgi:tetraacyldisaccharide 4'-kinase
VSVGEDRQKAIAHLMQLEHSPGVLLLDDAFQHRRVKAGLNILLTSYNDLYVNDMVLPTGNLREPKSGAKRADIIIVTKCPENISESEQISVKNQLQLESHQQLFFSSIVYAETMVSGFDESVLEDLKAQKFTLVTGIANPKPLVDFLGENGFEFQHKAYKDHHDFTASDINELEAEELIVTTEKDYVRLKDQLKNDNIFYLPIRTKLLNAETFDAAIKSFINRF